MDSKPPLMAEKGLVIQGTEELFSNSLYDNIYYNNRETNDGKSD